MQLGVHSADDANAFAEIDLSMSRRMSKRHKDLARPQTRKPHIILYDRIAARKPMFDPQPFENPLSRVPLLWWRHLIGLENRVVTGMRGPSFGRSGALLRT